MRVGLGVTQAAGLLNQRDAIVFTRSRSISGDRVRVNDEPDAIMPAATDKVAQSTFRNRLSVNERFTVSMLAAGV